MNEPLGFHVVLRLHGSRAIAKDAPTLRAASRVIHRLAGRRGLFAFRIADTHAHVVLLGGRREAGATTRFIESALVQVLRLPASFEPARISPVDDVRHLANLLRYVGSQEQHHGTQFDPAHDGSSVPDLLGMRVVACVDLWRRLHTELPRLTQATLMRDLGIEFADDYALPLAGEAAAAAFGLGTIAGRTSEHRAAQMALVHALSSRLPTRSLGEHAVVSARAIQRMRNEPLVPAHVTAFERQLALRSALMGRHHPCEPRPNPASEPLATPLR